MKFLLRPGRALDAGRLGAILTAGGIDKPWKPYLHSGAEDIAFVGRMIDRGWITVAARADTDEPLGFLALDDSYVHALFVAGSHRSRGVGGALVAMAKARCDSLTLWTFQANTGAQRFYLREGFSESGRTDGRDNDERLPDVQFRWQKPVAPLTDLTATSAEKA